LNSILVPNAGGKSGLVNFHFYSIMNLKNSHLLSINEIEPVIYFLTLQIDLHTNPPFIEGHEEIEVKIKKSINSFKLHVSKLKIISIQFLNEERNGLFS